MSATGIQAKTGVLLKTDPTTVLFLKKAYFPSHPDALIDSIDSRHLFVNPECMQEIEALLVKRADDNTYTETQK